MGFLAKLKFWKRNNKTPTKVDAYMSTEDPWTCDAASLTMDPMKVDACVPTKDPKTCDAASLTMDPTKVEFGFRKRHSTIHQVHRIVNDIATSLEEKKYCNAVFLDISQAFDRIWHPGLLFKLKHALTSN